MHKMLCGNFRESKEKNLNLDDVDGNVFIKALDVWCGRKVAELDEVPHVASVADRFQMTELKTLLEEALMRNFGR